MKVVCKYACTMISYVKLWFYHDAHVLDESFESVGWGDILQHTECVWICMNLLPLQAPCPWTFLSLAALAALVVLFLQRCIVGENAAWFSDITDVTDVTVVLRHLPFLSFLFRGPERVKLGKSDWRIGEGPGRWRLEKINWQRLQEMQVVDEACIAPNAQRHWFFIWRKHQCLSMIELNLLGHKGASWSPLRYSLAYLP